MDTMDHRELKIQRVPIIPAPNYPEWRVILTENDCTRETEMTAAQFGKWRKAHGY